RQTSTTQEYLSLIDTFFVAHTVNEELLKDEDRRIYEEMRRLEAMGTYTNDEINHLAREDKQRGHIVGVGRVLPARATASPRIPYERFQRPFPGDKSPGKSSPATGKARFVAGEST
nr:F-box domain, leucine-rich repeat domain, L domain-like protein [Tanacetum cinerariifolium]